MILSLLFACVAEYCAHAAPDLAACKCYPAEGGPQYVVTIRRGGAVVYEGRRDTVNFTTKEIEVFRKDLDGDGHAEIIAADFSGMSNGMAVRYWTLAIVDGRTGATTDVPLVEYGDGSIRGSTILVTSWEWIGSHLYFVARPYRYESGKLLPEKARGMWRRRYLFSFERERARGGSPKQWLRRATHVTWEDPPQP